MKLWTSFRNIEKTTTTVHYIALYERYSTLNVVIKIFRIIVSKICPADPIGVRRLTRETAENKLIDVLRKVIASLKRGIAKTRLFLAPMSTSIDHLNTKHFLMN